MAKANTTSTAPKRATPKATGESPADNPDRMLFRVTRSVIAELDKLHDLAMAQAAANPEVETAADNEEIDGGYEAIAESIETARRRLIEAMHLVINLPGLTEADLAAEGTRRLLPRRRRNSSPG